jgi:hypothetical protein
LLPVFRLTFLHLEGQFKTHLTRNLTHAAPIKQNSFMKSMIHITEQLVSTIKYISSI